MKLPRRTFLYLAAGAAALPSVSRVAWAQSYPARPVRILVGFAAGQAIDILVRIVAQSLSDQLGAQFVIENRPGAGGNLAAEVVVRSPPDGHTLLAVGMNNMINATLYERLSFNFIRDIAPVASILRAPQVMLVNPSVPARTMSEFITYAKANPGKINMASAGVGSPTHLSGELFKMMTGINMLHVPYRGSPAALTDLIAGTGPGDVRQRGVFARAHQDRAVARAGGDDDDPLGGSPRHPDRERCRAGFRDRRHGRHRRAEGHASRHRREAQ